MSNLWDGVTMDMQKEILKINLEKAYRDTDLAMSACNATPVAGLLHDIMKNVLWPISHELGYGTEFVNTHPLVICLVNKLAELSDASFERTANTAFSNLRHQIEEMDRAGV